MIDRNIAKEIRSTYRKQLKSSMSIKQLSEIIYKDFGMTVNDNTLYCWRYQLQRAKKARSSEPSIRLLKSAIHALAVAVDEVCCDLADNPHPAIKALKAQNWSYFRSGLKGPKRQG